MRRVVLFFLLLGLACLPLACRMKFPQRPEARNFTDNEIHKVSVMRVAVEEKPLVMTATARVVPVEKFEITSAPGIAVERVFVEEGQRVAQGETVLEFVSEDFDLKLDLARAELAEAEAAVVDYSYSLQNKDRLLEEDKISEVLANGLEKKIAHARATIVRAKAEVAYLDKKEAPSSPVVLAPFDGMISIKDVSLGSMPEAGKKLLELVKLDPIRLIFEIPYDFVDAITRDIPVTAVFSSIPGREFVAQIQMIGPDINQAKQTIEIKALLANPEEILKPGLTAQVSLRTDRRTRVLKIPAQAIWEEDDHHYCYRVDKDRLERVSVDGEEEKDGRWLITRGLKESDLVLVSNRDDLHDGSHISAEIIEAPLF